MPPPSDKILLSTSNRFETVTPLDYSRLTPAACLAALREEAHRVLLESSAMAAGQGRYSFLGASPFLILRTSDTLVTLSTNESVETFHEDPCSVIRALLNRFHAPPSSLGIPFAGGAMGLFAYDLARRLERLPHMASTEGFPPDIYLMFFDTVVAWDHHLNKAWLIHTAFDELQGREEVHRRLTKALERYSPEGGQPAGSRIGEPSSNLGRAGYIDRVVRCKAYIAAGDIFQANVSHRFSVPLAGIQPETLYTVSRSVNPSPYAGVCLTPEFSIVSTSPERLVCVRDGLVQTRPIAGTRPRGIGIKEEMRRKDELLTNPKERAEHLMLVDLERNDLGRVSQYGSVEVDQWMTTETYSHVIHIVSNIRGRLQSGLDAVDVLRAVFPGGTITGVPKVRCMEIIEELEPVRRWAYTGSLGYLSFAGDMDLNILIRTLILKDNVGYFQVGAGIVADSVPDAEYEETLHKAGSFFEILRRLRSEYGQ